MALFYYTIFIIKVQHIVLVIVLLVSLSILFAITISKLSIDPLQEYVTNLQNLSKDTLHELNIPVSTIQTNTQMLQKNITDEKSKKRLMRIQKASDILLERYSELDYMIKAQTSQNLDEEIELDKLITDKVDFLSSLYHDVKFQLDLEKSTIIIDKIGLSKTIDNIIDNGVKYSKDKKVITITLKDKRLSIKDFGVGIDEVELVKIFDRYYQNDDSMQGFGIGLNMVKRFCDKNQIKLAFNSKVGVGTTVVLEFR